MSALSGLAKGDKVAMLVPLTKPDLDGCRHMHWALGEIVSIKGGYAVARHDEYERTFALDTGEQTNGRGCERGPGWIEVINEAARLRIAEGALKKSEYERREHAREAIYDLASRLTTEALERIAAMMAGEDEVLAV